MGERQLYNAADLKALASQCRSIVKQNGDLGVDVAHAFYWVLRGRPLTEIRDLYPAIDMDGVVFPFIRSYRLAIVVENCEQLIADRAERLEILERIKATQKGAAFYNLNVVDKDPNLPWERLEQNGDTWSVRIQDQKETVTSDGKGRKNRKLAHAGNAVVANGTDSKPLAKTATASPAISTAIIGQKLPQPPLASPAKSVRVTYAVVTPTSRRQLNLTEFLRSEDCRSFADAVRAVCGHIGVPECCGAVLAKFKASPKGLVSQPSITSSRELALFNGGFSECFSRTSAACVAAQRIFNVVRAITNPETVTASESSGYVRRSVASELAPGGDSITAIRSRLPSNVR